MVESKTCLKIDNSIYYQTFFLLCLSIFLVSIGQIYHLGIIGVIVMIRTIFVFLKNKKYIKSFSFVEKNRTFSISFGYDIPFTFSISKNNILKIDIVQKGIFRKKISIIYLKNGDIIPIDYVTLEDDKCWK